MTVIPSHITSRNFQAPTLLNPTHQGFFNNIKIYEYVVPVSITPLSNADFRNPRYVYEKIRMSELQKYEFQVNCIFPIHKDGNVRA
jgi:hypothetical protein